MMNYVISNLVSAETFRLHNNVHPNPTLRAEKFEKSNLLLGW